MYPVTAQFLDTIRGAHRAYGYIEAWYGGTQLALEDGSKHLPLQETGQNQVDVDASTPGVRRKLTATLAPLPGLWELLAPIGTELRAFTAVRYPSGVTETVPQGRFDVDVQRLGYGPDGSLQITAPDRWVRVQNARFFTPRQFSGGTARSVIASLLLEASGVPATDVSTSTAGMTAQTPDRDRDRFIQSVATAASLDVFFDRNGVPVIRDTPAISGAYAWTVDAGPGGVMLSAERERNRQKTYNIVVVNGTAVNGVAPFPTQYVWDNDPNSPTYAGPGPGYGGEEDLPAPGSAGPFGQRPTFYSSPLLANAPQAVSAGVTILARVTGLAAQLTLTSVSNPALDDGDTILVRLPRERRDQARPVELHLADNLTVPLVPSKNPQQISTRSTRADDVEDT